MKSLGGAAPRPPASASRALRAWSLMACLAFSCAAVPAGADRLPDTGRIPLPSLSRLPRLRPLWSAPFLSHFQGPPTQAVVRQGILLGFDHGHRAGPGPASVPAVVALDVRSGRERWRKPWPSSLPVPYLVFAGGLALLQDSSGGTMTLDLETGKRRWQRKICRFRADLEIPTGTPKEIAVGVCRTEGEREGKAGSRLTPYGGGVKKMVVAINMRSGKILWRFPTGLAGIPLAAGENAVFAATHEEVVHHNPPRSDGSGSPHVFLSHRDSHLWVLDPLRGTVMRSVRIREMDPVSLRVTTGKPGIALVSGYQVSAVSMMDGRPIWPRIPPGEPYESHLPPPRLLGNRAFLVRKHKPRILRAQYRILELEFPSGTERGVYEFPVGLRFEASTPILPGKSPGSLLAAFRSPTHAWVTARFDRPGAPASLAVLPAEYGDPCFLAEGLVLVGRQREGTLTAYSAFEELPPATQDQTRDRVENLDGPEDTVAVEDLVSLLSSGYDLTGSENWPPETRPRLPTSPCLHGPDFRTWAQAGAYRRLASLGGSSDLEALDYLDDITAPLRGWTDLCHEYDPWDRPGDESIRQGLCRGIDAGPYRFTQARAVWVRRRDRHNGFGPPAFAFNPCGDTAPACPRLSLRPSGAGRYVLAGDDGAGGRSWRTDLEPPELLFADADGDGLTDRTEKALGTDPARADMDGDGVLDGVDPAPRAGPARTEEGRAMDEVVRYLTLFLLKGPISLYADPALWSGGGGSRSAGIVLHWPRKDARETGCPPTLFCADGKRAEERSRGGTRCEVPLAIEGVKIEGKTAEALVAWPDADGHRVARRLELAKRGGKWRVIGDRAGN